MGRSNIRTAKIEVAVVLSTRIEIDGEGHASVVEQYNQPFTGPRAKQRALNLLESIKGDFPEAKGWHHIVWGNDAACEAWTDSPKRESVDV